MIENLMGVVRVVEKDGRRRMGIGILERV